MKMINQVTLIIKRTSFPSFIDELYKRDCELVDLQHIEETDEGHLYTMSIASGSIKRFEEFITIIGASAEKYKIISLKNALEERAAGGLLNISGKIPFENSAEFNTWVLGAAGFIREQILKERGLGFTGITRSVCLVSGIKSSNEAVGEQLLLEYSAAERDAVILNRFVELNGYPLVVRFDHPEDMIKVLKQVEQNFSAVRISRIDGATIMLYDMIYSEIGVPVTSLEHDDIPLYLFLLLLRIMIKYKLKPEETTIGLIGINLSAVRLARVLGVVRFRRVLGCDQSESAMLELENQGGLATTAENIFSNADITLFLKGHDNREDLLKIRPGQIVVSFMSGEAPDKTVIWGKGVREYLCREPSDLAALFPGILRGAIESGARSMNDLKVIEYSKKLVPLLSESFEFPNLFSDIHDRVTAVVKSGAGQQ